MQYHVILTKECNLNCSYCGGGSDSPPKDIQYSITDLKRFVSLDTAPVIEFYGGEPLLRIDTMEKIMDMIPARFVIQTNGLLLDRIRPEYLKKFHSILVSIDGRKEVTDRNRRSGIYERITRNVRLIRERGFRGDLIARMTVPQGTDIYENVRHLYDLGIFENIHWQLGFEMFWGSWNEEENSPEEWIGSYNHGITSLVEWWILEMESRNKVPGIVPFVCIMNSMLLNTPALLRCGSGIDFFTIMPDGRISACPVSIDFDFSIVGSIFHDAPATLCNKAAVGEPCISCHIFQICGGRCLFVNLGQNMLRKNGYDLICKTVRHLVRELEGALPKVQKFIDRGIIASMDFNYPEFNNGCEIIP
ncbi:MAG: TIGR04084 family radical SAM/SPASM domain-containing protein [Candidatus Methanoperedens sp.]|nr:TIGR04084 family radical SAM/SPASM domain-containing protein [Candidatus Methanoperedens sp.]